MNTSKILSGAYALWEEKRWNEDTIESDYLVWQRYYQLSMDLSDGSDEKRTDLLNLAMASCRRALKHTGTHKERLIKIDALLLMMDIVTLVQEDPEWERQRYFYDAVGIARYSLGDGIFKTPYEIKEWYNESDFFAIVEKIKKSYCTNINPGFDTLFTGKWHSQFLPLLNLSIKVASDEKIAQRMDQVKNNKIYIAPKDTPKNILDKLEAVLGPVRLVIIAAESGEICMHHRIGRAEAECLHENSHGIYTTRVDVFHKGKMYQYIIDRGSREPTPVFDDAQTKKVIEPMIKTYIERMEQLYFVTHADHSACIRQHEEKQNRGEPQDYSAFIERVLSGTTIGASNEELDTAEQYARSIDIARLMISSSHSKHPPTTSEFYEQIDRISWGKIDRRVYHMVTSILLSRNETMHGTGYPFWLQQKTISLEARLYAIIKAYETLYSMHPKHPEIVISKLENWSWGWYLDRGLKSLFVATLGEPHTEPVGEKLPVTDYRMDRYAPYRERWKQLITLTDETEHLYDEFRGIWVSDARQKALNQLIDRKRLEIHRVAQLINIIIIERHELTESDIQEVSVPWGAFEWLIPTGISNAEEKWKILQGIAMRILTGPLPRAIGTAKIVCQNVYKCMGACDRCLHVESVPCLTNPPKHREDGQALSLLSKFISFWEGQKDLYQLVLDIVSSSRQSTHLIITHGDIIRHLLLMIRYSFDKEEFRGLRDRVEQQMVYTYLFRWDRIVDWDLMFSISDWSVMLRTINALTKRIFDDTFYERGNRRVNLIRLRDKFLDYIDDKNETDPEKVRRFIQALDDNPLTQHFSAILRREWVIK